LILSSLLTNNGTAPQYLFFHQFEELAPKKSLV